MNQQIIDGRGVLYSGLFDCITKTVRTEGAMSLFKGLPAHAMRIGPHTVLTFVFWEKYKRIASELRAR
jgi:solute carrier family 25, member 34/35